MYNITFFLQKKISKLPVMGSIEERRLAPTLPEKKNGVGRSPTEVTRKELISLPAQKRKKTIPCPSEYNEKNGHRKRHLMKEIWFRVSPGPMQTYSLITETYQPMALNLLTKFQNVKLIVWLCF